MERRGQLGISGGIAFRQQRAEPPDAVGPGAAEGVDGDEATLVDLNTRAVEAMDLAYATA